MILRKMSNLARTSFKDLIKQNFREKTKVKGIFRKIEKITLVPTKD